MCSFVQRIHDLALESHACSKHYLYIQHVTHKYTPQY